MQASLPCEIVKKYPGQEQVDQSVSIKIPGHWFNGMDASDKAKLFDATAVEYSKCRPFGQGRALAKAEAIRFQVNVCFIILCLILIFGSMPIFIS